MAKKIDLNKLSLDQLKTLSKDIDKAMKAAEKDARKAALSDIEAAARKHGFSLSELTGKAAKRGPKAAAAPKYRHPENPEVTWSGRGRQPVWFKEAIDGGMKPEKLAI